MTWQFSMPKHHQAPLKSKDFQMHCLSFSLSCGLLFCAFSPSVPISVHLKWCMEPHSWSQQCATTLSQLHLNLSHAQHFIFGVPPRIQWVLLSVGAHAVQDVQDGLSIEVTIRTLWSSMLWIRHGRSFPQLEGFVSVPPLPFAFRTQRLACP